MAASPEDSLKKLLSGLADIEGRGAGIAAGKDGQLVGSLSEVFKTGGDVPVGTTARTGAAGPRRGRAPPVADPAPSSSSRAKAAGAGRGGAVGGVGGVGGGDYTTDYKRQASPDKESSPSSHIPLDDATGVTGMTGPGHKSVSGMDSRVPMSEVERLQQAFHGGVSSRGDIDAALAQQAFETKESERRKLMKGEIDEEAFTSNAEEFSYIMKDLKHRLAKAEQVCSASLLPPSLIAILSHPHLRVYSPSLSISLPHKQHMF